MIHIIYFVALLILVLVYVIAKFFISRVESLAGIAEILAVIIGVLAALLYLGALPR